MFRRVTILTEHLEFRLRIDFTHSFALVDIF